MESECSANSGVGPREDGYRLTEKPTRPTLAAAQGMACSAVILVTCGFSGSPILLKAGQYGSVSALLFAAWLRDPLVREGWTDYAMAALSLSYIARFVFQESGVGGARISGLYLGLILFWLVRTIRHVLVRNVLICFLAGGAAFLAVVWIAACHKHMQAALGLGFSDLTSLKAGFRTPLGGSINEWAGVMLLGMVFQFALLRPASPPFNPINLYALACFLPTFSGLLLTFSRGAYLAAGGFVAVMLVGIWLRTQRQSRPIMAVALLAALTASVVVVDRMSNGGVRLASLFRFTEQQRRSDAGRLHVWSGALRISMDHLLVGSGPGTFAMRYVPRAGLSEGLSFVGRPLNTPVGLLAEEGVAGLSLYLLATVAIAVSSWKLISATGTRGDLLPEALLAGFGAFCLREVTFSSLLENALIGSLFFVLAGMLTGMEPPCGAAICPTSRPRPYVWPLMLTCVALAGFGLFVVEHRRTTADATAALAARAISQGDAEAASALLDAALQAHPTPYYYSLRALNTARQNMQAFQSNRPTAVTQAPARQRRLRAALADYSRAIGGNPDDDSFWHNRSWIQLALGDPVNGCIEDSKRAAQIDGSNSVYGIALGLLLENAGRASEAAEEYTKAIAASPGVTDSPFADEMRLQRPLLWKALLVRAIGLLHARDPDHSDANASARLARIYLEIGDGAGAERLLRSVVARVPQFPRAWANLARLQFGADDLDGAEISLRKAVFLDPGDPIAWSLLGQVAARNGDERNAESFARRGRQLALTRVSAHARRVGRVYKTSALVADDLLPPGLLAYCSPAAGSRWLGR